MRGQSVRKGALLACAFAGISGPNALASEGGTAYDPSQTVPGGAEYGSVLKTTPKSKPARKKKKARPKNRAVPKNSEPAAPTPAPGAVATLTDGVAHAPAGAPREVVLAIEAGNRLQGKPYKYGGGHRQFEDDAYDCSGTVSYALNAANLLDSPLDSGSLMKWGEAGPGAWITVYTNKGHVYIVIAGLRLDTSRVGSSTPPAIASRKRDQTELGTGPLWQVAERSSDTFEARHPAGL